MAASYTFLLTQSAVALGNIRRLLSFLLFTGPGRARGRRTDPEQGALLFSRVKPRLAVYSHIAFFAAPGAGIPTEQDLIAAIRKTYSGPLVLGEDLMSFRVGKKDIVVRSN